VSLVLCFVMVDIGNVVLGEAFLVEERLRSQKRLSGESVRVFRKYMGWSVKVFAERMGVHVQTVYVWERGGQMTRPSEKLLRLMVDIKIRFPELLRLVDEKKRKQREAQRDYEDFQGVLGEAVEREEKQL